MKTKRIWVDSSFFFVPLQFPNLFAWSATLTIDKMTSQVEEFVMPILEEAGLFDKLLQQDGASPHFHNGVTDFLNSKFPEKLIGRGGYITWPPRSPDLTPL
jgi:hypothetical protein